MLFTSHISSFNVMADWCVQIQKVGLVVSCGLDRRMYLYQCVLSALDVSWVQLTLHFNLYADIALILKMHESVNRVLNFIYHLIVSCVLDLVLILYGPYAITLVFRCVSDQPNGNHMLYANLCTWPTSCYLVPSFQLFDAKVCHKLRFCKAAVSSYFSWWIKI